MRKSWLNYGFGGGCRLEIRSSTFTANSGKRISIPTYPFAKERYWVPSRTKKTEIPQHSFQHHLQKKWRENPFVNPSETKEYGLTVAFVNQDTESIARSICSDIDQENLIVIKHHSSFIKHSDQMFECSLLDENHAYDVIREIFSGGERQVQNIIDFRYRKPE